MKAGPQPLTASLWWHLLLPRGLVLLGWWATNQLLQLPSWLLAGLICMDLALLFWCSRKHLHVADDHLRGSGAMAPVWAGYLLVILATLTSLTLWWEAWLITHRQEPELSYAQERARQRAASYNLTQVGTTLVFEGEITFGLIQNLQNLLAQDPKITRLQLSGPGGHVYEARGAAQLVRQHGLNTYASGSCASACTLIFAAGHTRQLAPGARLGFHGYSLQVFGGLPQVDPAQEQAKDRAFLRQQGISASFLDQAFATPPETMWFPPRHALLQAGVLRQ